MTSAQYLQNLSVPTGPVDVVLDTDTYNEADDQFALAYLLASSDKLHTKAIYAAPFFNDRSESPADGMEKSYEEIFHLLKLLGKEYPVYRGSKSYLSDEKTPVASEACEDLVTRARAYSPEKPLYVVAIGAITNIASALLMAPEIAENLVVVWLGGHARHFANTREFNMLQDIAAARVVMKSGVPFVQLPCMGVVSSFTVSEWELRHYLENTTPIGDYLCKNTIEYMKAHTAHKTWTKCIWDVTAVAWLLNDNNRFMASSLEKIALPTYDHVYSYTNRSPFMCYVYDIHRDALLEDLVEKLTKPF